MQLNNCDLDHNNLNNYTYGEVKDYIKFIENGYAQKKVFFGVEKIVTALLNDKRKNVNTLGMKLEAFKAKTLLEIARVNNMYNFDKQFGEYRYVAGVDEVGRGPLAGPIVSAAVVLDVDDLYNNTTILGIKDSKKLSIKAREELSEIIKSKAISYSIALLENDDIDKKGIAWCNNEVFKIACANLNVKPDLVLSDGYAIKRFDIKNEFVIKGDEKSASIACASIIAKVYRDKLMEEYSKIYSCYGFERNMGYGTKEHIEAIKKYGQCSIHRTSFLTNL